MTDSSPPSPQSLSSTTTSDEGEIAALRESQRMLSSLLQNLPGIAYRMLIDEQWTMRFISAGCFRLTGYTPEDIIGNRRISYEQLTHPDDRQRARAIITTALAARRPYDLVYRIITAEGLERWVWERGQGIANDSGEMKFLEGFLTDITERRQAEEQVKAQAELLDKARDAILVIGIEGRVIYCNQSAHVLFGWNAANTYEYSLHDLCLSADAGFAEAHEIVLQKGDWSGELMAVGRGNRRLILDSRWTLVRDEHGAPQSILLLNTDVTERKHLEAQLLRSQRIESIGTLAGGIAHDLNNILSPILTSLDLIRANLRGTDAHDLVDIVEASANRGAEMVQQILTFARGADSHRAQFDPRRLLVDLDKITRETFPRNLVIELNSARDLWPIMGDHTQLHQVLLNLCVNARDAMPDGGKLVVRSENLVLTEEDAILHPDQGPGKYVLLRVSDTGTGIAESIREKIFDPFFTTKEPGKGTGLGLSTVQAIIKNHNGTINVVSEVGRGTTFHILLPATEMNRVDAAVGVENQLPRGRGELILVVDDEAGVLMITQRTLENYGYRVVTAKNGADGLTIFLPNRHDIAAVITDVMMPVMDGPTMIREIRRFCPDFPIIATSGLSGQEYLAKAHDAGVQAFLAKPYTAEAVLRSIANLLAARNAGA